MSMGYSNLSYQKGGKKKKKMCYLNYSTAGRAKANKGLGTLVN